MKFTATRVNRPCKVETTWPATSFTHKTTGVTWHYEEFTTRPLQDHKEDSRGITILAETDNRMQPWNEVVKANVHEKAINHLPSKKAAAKEVKEYLYLVVTKDNVKGSKLDLDRKPFLANTTLGEWKGTGKDLRKLSLRQFCELCPATWVDVKGEKHINSIEERALVGNHLWSVIHPLVVAEELQVTKAEHDNEKKAANPKKVSRFSRFKLWLCCADRDAKDLWSDSDTLPEYKEKMSLNY